MLGPFGKMGKLRLGQSPKGRASPRSRLGSWWRRDSNPRVQTAAPALSALPPTATGVTPVSGPRLYWRTGETEAPASSESPIVLPRPESARPRPEAELRPRPPGAGAGARAGAGAGEKNEFSCRPVAVSIDRAGGGLARSCRRTIIGKNWGGCCGEISYRSLGGAAGPRSALTAADPGRPRRAEEGVGAEEEGGPHAPPTPALPAAPLLPFPSIPPPSTRG